MRRFLVQAAIDGLIAIAIVFVLSLIHITQPFPFGQGSAPIIQPVADGIFVKKMGGGQVDVVSGNFAFEVTECYRIRDGKLAEPLRGATLVGQGPKLMSEIDMVGWDLGYSTGTCGKDGQGAPVADAQPTLRIPSVVIGGKIQ